MIDHLNEDTTNPLDDLKKALSKPMSERYFDIDELLYLFDVAYDHNDYYFMNEVLMIASRLYPDSPEFEEKKLIYYEREGDESRTMRRHLGINEESEGIVWDVMRLKAEHPSGDKAEKGLDLILSSAASLADEEVIQFVKIATELGCYDYLLRVLPELRGKAERLSCLLYELAMSAIDMADNRTAIELLEELTEIEPFVADYWMLLSSVYSSQGNYLSAKNAIELAKAIKPADKEVRREELEVLSDLATTPYYDSEGLLDGEYDFRAKDAAEAEKKFYDLIDGYIADYPDDGFTRALKFQVHLLRGKVPNPEEFEKAVEECPGNLCIAFGLSAWTSFPLEKAFAGIASQYSPEMANDIVDIWITRLAEMGKAARAVDVAMANAAINPMQSEANSRVLYAFYLAKDFKGLNEFVVNCHNLNWDIAKNYVSLWILSHAALIGGAEYTEIMMDLMSITAPPVKSGNILMLKKAFETILEESHSFYSKYVCDKKRKKVPWESFDPLNLWGKMNVETEAELDFMAFTLFKPFHKDSE